MDWEDNYEGLIGIKMWKEAVMVWVELLFQDFPEEIEKFSLRLAFLRGQNRTRDVPNTKQEC